MDFLILQGSSPYFMSFSKSPNHLELKIENEIEFGVWSFRILINLEPSSGEPHGFFMLNFVFSRLMGLCCL